MTLPAFCSIAFFRFSQDYTLVVKIDADISWCRQFQKLTAFRRQNARAVLILSVLGLFHRLLAVLET